MLSLAPGDLAFFFDSLTDTPAGFGNAVVSSSRERLSQTPYHVALISSVLPSITVIHALPSDGVVEQNFQSFLEAEKNKGKKIYCRLYAVLLPESLKLRAVQLARMKINCGYNNIFSPKFINSEGLESYYCCQLVARIYHLAAGWQLFGQHRMKFSQTDGKILPYWVEHFGRLGRIIPENQPGTHPALLLKANFLAPLQFTESKL